MSKRLLFVSALGAVLGAAWVWHRTRPPLSLADAEHLALSVRVADPRCREGDCGVYYCPEADEVECPTHGGFDLCCCAPRRHVPLTAGDYDSADA
ncbi:hypothetical protein ACIBQX_28105 [Nonomuraea sp. NPDC049714]|uniref:hypothetical protein n=1 Tax=Nonomuraea sp. NPDC049714 TaxID=3364357 RepID=UPI00379812D3